MKGVKGFRGSSRAVVTSFKGTVLGEERVEVGWKSCQFQGVGTNKAGLQTSSINKKRTNE